MSEKIKEALQNTDYRKPNFTGLFIAVGIVIAISYFFFVIPPFQPEEVKHVVNDPIERIRFKAVYPKPEVQAHNFLLPAYGTVEIDRLDSCITNSITPHNAVTRNLRAGTVIFYSKAPEPVLMRVWFYEQGNFANCRKANDALVARGLIR